MLIRRILGKLLFSLSGSMNKACVASWLSAGVEDMPESMKKMR